MIKKSIGTVYAKKYKSIDNKQSIYYSKINSTIEFAQINHTSFYIFKLKS